MKRANTSVILQYIILIPILILSGCFYFKSGKDDINTGRQSLRDILLSNHTNTVDVIYFDIYSYFIDIEDEDSLMRAARLHAISNMNVYLSGHADKTGEKKLNEELSRERVKAAKEYLLKLGMKEEHIYTEYFGDEKPALQEESLEAYAKNRRVEIILTKEDVNLLNGNSQILSIGQDSGDNVQINER
jgi:outer membrane protein OmpA-like peptidoglycan-associated protein